MPSLLVAAVGGFALGALVAFVWLFERRTVLRREGLEQSRAVLKGQIGEQLAPLLPGFEFSLADARFLGAPIDYVVFDGYSDGDDVEVVFVEVKSGNARLSSGERRVRDAVRAGRVRFCTLRLEE